MTFFHAVVWLDHSRARVIHFDHDHSKTIEIHHHSREPHLAYRRWALGSGHALEDQHYYHSIAEALDGPEDILVVGPADAKLELIKHIHHHAHDLVDHLVGVETVDNLAESQVLEFARQYFSGAERARPREAFAASPRSKD
jgi:hypothetical protein